MLLYGSYTRIHNQISDLSVKSSGQIMYMYVYLKVSQFD